MTPDEYVALAVRTEATDMEAIADRLLPLDPNLKLSLTGPPDWLLFNPLTMTEGIPDLDFKPVRLLHAAIGMCTETGELQDQLKKHIFYGKPLDTTNLVEEMGDLMWYVGIMCDTLKVSLEDVMIKNIAKLKARYPEKFTEDKALNRNLFDEREVLEGVNEKDKS